MERFLTSLVSACAALALAAPLAHAVNLDLGITQISTGGQQPPKVDAQPANGVSDHSAKLRASIDPKGEDTSYRFELGTTTAYGTATPSATLQAGNNKVDVSASVTGLTAGTTYHFRAVASNASGTNSGPDGSFKTTGTVPTATPPDDNGQDPAPGGTPGTGPIASVPTLEPAMGRTAVAGATAGTVLVKEQGSSRFRALTAEDSVPVNSVLDARQGTVSLTTARGAGVTQTGTFRAGIFQVRQSRTGHGMTDIVLRGGSFASCPKATARSSRTASAAAAHKVRRLWSKDRHGRFRTYGRSSIATVRGTSWYTEDRCDGTLTRVSSGKVLVRERKTGRSRLVTRGHSFLARAAR